MRVICIENSLCVDEEGYGSIRTHKGSIYHVIDVVSGEEMREKTGINFASGPWYLPALNSVCFNKLSTWL